ncbi:hypothetical protein [Ferruginibacter albus]|uniref:hypothetical protein n=1 Tax=Ferruginibacter albus TaxID=2875540 RepID=UPI001CC387C1|nr:hypothetical protein [Ferruginibacter albus]UAY52719.1 hypothetical protein K9M53_03260 [Ferruginibacter albus]
MADYLTNTNSYAKTCINKANPKMHCNGKCQMMRKLQQEERNKNADNQSENKNNDIVLSSRSFFPVLPAVKFINNDKIKYPFLSVNKERKMPRSFFHPPGMLS